MGLMTRIRGKCSIAEMEGKSLRLSENDKVGELN